LSYGRVIRNCHKYTNFNLCIFTSIPRLKISKNRARDRYPLFVTID